jgi:hypothetical protein
MNAGTRPAPVFFQSGMEPTLSPGDRQILEALQQAVTNELDRKTRLGHYVVSWQNGQAVLQGPDAPETATDDHSRGPSESEGRPRHASFCSRCGLSG